MAVMARQFRPGQLRTGSLYDISSSFALTASFALNGGGGGGSSINTGSFVTTSSFNSFTASYNSGSFTGSFVGVLVGTASNATTASYIQNAQTASYVLQSVSSSFATTASYFNETDPIFVAKSGSFATTGSNIFKGSQTISGSNGKLIYTGTTPGAIPTLAEVHAYNDLPWLERFYNDTYSTSSAVMAYFGQNDGRFVFHNESTRSIGLQVNGYNAENGLLVYEDKVAFVNNVEVTGSLNVIGAITGSLFGTASWANNAVTASYTPNYLPLTGGTINGNVTVNGTASIAFLNVTYESASVIYSSGSNQFGDAVNDTQTLIGRTIVSGSLEVTGSANLPFITGSLFGTASWAQNAQTASYVLNAVSSSFSTTASFATTASYSLTALSASYAPTIIPSGAFGIANSSGSYTYYANFSASIAAATSGQTVEMFADVTETGSVTITLKDGVTVNGNGHTYNHTQAGTSDVFETTVAGTYRIYNLNVIRTNATGGFVLRARNYVVSLHYFDNSYFITNQGGISSESANVIQRFYNANITITGTGTAFIGLQDNEVYNATLRATSTATGNLFNIGIIYNSTLNHEGNATAAFNLDAFNCTFISRGGGQTIQTGRNISNCSIYNYANYGNFVNCNQFNNCLIYSAASFGSYTEATTYYRNCVITSAANIGAAYGIHYNNSITSLANIGAQISTNNRLENCVIQSLWNNAGGHAVKIVANSTFIKNSSLNVTNTSANCINAASAFTSKYSNNSLEGATIAVNANITQGIINTQDNFGNIII